MMNEEEENSTTAIVVVDLQTVNEESQAKLICRFKKRVILTTKPMDNVKQVVAEKKIKEGQISTSPLRKKPRKHMTPPLIPASTPPPPSLQTEKTVSIPVPLPVPVPETISIPIPIPTPVPTTLLKAPTTTICEHCNRPFYIDDNYTKHVI